MLRLKYCNIVKVVSRMYLLLYNRLSEIFTFTLFPSLFVKFA